MLCEARNKRRLLAVSEAKRGKLTLAKQSEKWQGHSSA
nr:MAG TPA: hypothetical protein [Caudoviricetes sp.]